MQNAKRKKNQTLIPVQDKHVENEISPLLFLINTLKKLSTTIEI